MRSGCRDPCWISDQLRARGGVCRPNSALPRCEARFEFLYRAGLRGYFGASWAVPRGDNRATKHSNI
jgi:hypothetical protein